MADIQNHLLNLKAEAASEHLTKYGSLDSFNLEWENQEPANLIAAKRLADADAAADAEAAKMSQRRSEMTVDQRVRFIAEHGQDAYLQLPA